MEPLIIPIVAILMPLFLVPTIIVLKHRHRKGEWEHRERMKAMEAQMPYPRLLVAGHSKGVAAIGAGVPVASVVAAFLTTIIWEPSTPDEIPIPAVAWGCAVVISLTAMLTSLILAFMHAKAAEKVESNAQVDYSKPVFDPDAFDVVGSRA